MSIYQENKVTFQPTYLYIKQHAITGKLYFGKTVQNPEKYHGSGTHWVNHIKKHGKEYVITLWYCLFLDQESCSEFALACSEQWNIVSDPGWLNLIQEDGKSGCPSGAKFSYIHMENLRKSCTTPEFIKVCSENKIGIKNPMYGLPGTNLGKIWTDESKQTQSDSQKNRSTVSARDLNGVMFQASKNDPCWKTGEIGGCRAHIYEVIERDNQKHKTARLDKLLYSLNYAKYINFPKLEIGQSYIFPTRRPLAKYKDISGCIIIRMH